ncbi:Glutamyl-tRNA reductase 1, chloroplastic [Hordeum vulgare]|nr:Glutamyl-tRNA reductase 1, chloroplastic [Hordeum vulgare]
MIKINLDGSFVPGEAFAGWDVVARSADGRIVGARAGRQEHVRDAFAAETVALSHVVSFAADLGLVRVTLETDSQLLLEAIDLRKADYSAYAAVIEDTKYQLKMWFSHHVILVCWRSANSVAHELASMGRLCDPYHCMQWDSDVPAAVVVCVLADVDKHG